MRQLLRLALLLSLLVPLSAPTSAFAQGYEDLDETGGEDGKKKKRRDRRSLMAELEKEVIREIVRGWYVRAGAGSGAYFGRYGTVAGYGSVLSAVSYTPLVFGQDFVDNERSSMAWEFMVALSVYNGMSFQTQAALNLPSNRLIQGDTRMFGLIAAYEYSAYPSRRIGIGPRVGAGVMFSPLIMDREAFDRDVVSDAWNGQSTVAHSRPHPLGFVGLQIEYYTKLSHFSIGADVDVAYQLDYDVNLRGAGWFKYTF
ncbi:MAG: adventurous gliding motility protein CglE [Deltaproteobacteria bacterium]|nr:adventurous gliding motility protein CglE [Deltaproteobacteria bacterium]MBW2254767.1 adventurous gliding motility protein CglE [Deltaproteobacteria bacterium]